MRNRPVPPAGGKASRHFLLLLVVLLPTLARREAWTAWAQVASGGHRLYWVGSWAAAQQVPEPRNALPSPDLRDVTLRQIVHLSAGGRALRVRLSNAFGVAPLHIGSAHVARPLSLAEGSIDPATDVALTFSGRHDVTIPAGAEYVSDPVTFPAAALSDLAVTLYWEDAPAQQTSHPGARETSFLAHGERVSAVSLPRAMTVTHWFLLAGVDVAQVVPASAIVILGDSITDGRGATTNGNDRWPDQLAQRLQAEPATRGWGVLNLGIGGNRLLQDGLGPNALARFDRDVAGQTAARVLLVLEGINDLGTLTLEHPLPAGEHAALVRRIVAAYTQLVRRAHGQGMRVMGATLTPDGDSGYDRRDARHHADRDAVNAWIRTPGHFDAVVDFDRAVRDPKHPEHLLPAFDSGDHLHLSPAGYGAMAAAVPLNFFVRSEAAPPDDAKPDARAHAVNQPRIQ